MISLVKVFEANYLYYHLKIVSKTSEGLNTSNYIITKQQKFKDEAFCLRIKIKLYQILCLRFTAI